MLAVALVWSLVLLPRPSPAAWSGPSLRLKLTTGGFPALELVRSDISHARPTLLPPHWLNINNQGLPDVQAIAE